MPVYKRRRKVNPNDTDVHVDFVDEVGDSFEEYIVYHRKFLTWMEVNGIDTQKRYSQEEIDELVKRSPYYKATANDVDWLMKVRMQGEIQKWVDHSISVTVNLPTKLMRLWLISFMSRHGVVAARAAPSIVMEAVRV